VKVKKNRKDKKAGLLPPSFSLLLMFA